ncbi:MAG: GAF domain-containing protein [Anaerolineales bacterium]|nr:GAF domain-containing protein [Anaerolineales bacterium]
MIPAEDCPLDPFRRPTLSWLSIFFDVGHILLSVGAALLVSAAVPAASPALAAGSLLLTALFLLPIKHRMMKRVGFPRENDFRGDSLEFAKTYSPFSLPSDASSAREADWESAGPTERREALLRFMQMLHSASDLDILLELTASQILHCVPAVSFRIALADEDPSFLAYAFSLDHEVRRGERENRLFTADEDLCGTVVRSGVPLVTGEYAETCRIRNLPARESASAWAGYPLSSGPSVIGAMLLLRDTPFTEGEQSLLESIAAAVGPAAAKARLVRESNRRTALVSGLVRASRLILGAAGRKDLPETILSAARDLLPCHSAILLLPESSESWKAAGRTGEAGWRADLPAVGMDHPFVRPIAGDRPAFLDRLPADDPFCSAADGGGAEFHSAVSLALRYREKTCGRVVFWNPLRAAPPREHDAMLLNAFAAICVAALEKDRPQAPPGSAESALSEELTSLQRLDQALNSASDPSEAMAVVLDWGIRYAEAACGLAAICTEDAFEVSAAFGYPPETGLAKGIRLPRDSEGFEEAVRTGQSFRMQSQGTQGRGLLPCGRVSLFLPIRRGVRILGVLLLESESEAAFPPAQAEFLERLASHAAIAISNAQLYAEVRNANQAKSEFISFVAHELKTPMTSIRGYTDLVAQGAVGPVSQPQANFLATIRLNVDRMAALVSDLNDVSRIESGRLKLEFSAVALSPAVDEVVEALRSQMEGKEQKLTLEIPADLPPAWVDRGRLIQILTNLVSNAYKYTPRGGVLRIAAERTSNRWDPSGPPEVVHFLIQDSGLGISLQEQKSIFQKFFRSEERVVRDLPGTGLGLHITRNLVEMHGGKIWFESELHKGSTFHFTVPAASL